MIRSIVDAGDEYGSAGTFFLMIVGLLTTKTIDVTDLETSVGEAVLGYVLLAVAALFLLARIFGVLWDRRYGPAEPSTVKAPAPPAPETPSQP